MRIELRLFVLFVLAFVLSGASILMAQNRVAAARIVDRIDETRLATVRGSTHPAMRAAVDNGRVSPSLAMSDLILVLRRSDAQQAALDAFNREQYDPESPNFHHWLKPQEFGSTYGVAQADLDTLTNWLQNHGFTIQETPASRMEIRFSGTAGQVESAFHTEMHAVTYRGASHIANTSDIQLPSALTPVVAGVKALHNFFPRTAHHMTPLLRRDASGRWTSVEPGRTLPRSSLPSGFQSSTPKSAGAQPAFGVSYNGSQFELMTPYDMATIYNYKSLWNAPTPINGTGQTIAIAGRSNIVLSDVASFRSATGLPANTPNIVITNSDPGTTSLVDDRAENTIDVEWAGAAAPGASITLVISNQDSSSTDASYLSESYIVNNNVASIMSASYQECELGLGSIGNQLYANLWQQAHTQGIAVFIDTGDSGSAECDGQDPQGSASGYAAAFGLSVNGIASTPYNVAVGGTDFNWANSSFSSSNASNLSNALGYIPEFPWNDTIANPLIWGALNSGTNENLDAEEWANYLWLQYELNGIDLTSYESYIVPAGGGGGVSSCTNPSGNSAASCSGGYAAPSWQAGVPGIVSSENRAIPDVSMFAADGAFGVAYLICDTFLPSSSGTGGTAVPCTYSIAEDALSEGAGGTSVSAPIMAGIMAMINQKAASAQGNPNPAFYQLAATQNYGNCSSETASTSSSCYFNDVDSGNNEAPCFGVSTNCTPIHSGDELGILPGYAATTGFDKASGLGSLNVANVVNGWPVTGGQTKATPNVSVTPRSSTITAAQALTLTVSVTGSNGTPTGSVTLAGGGYNAQADLNGGSFQFNIPANAFAAGNYSLVATYTPDSASASTYTSATGSASVTVTGISSGSFTLNNSGPITLARGATTENTASISVSPTGGFTGTVILTCSITTAITNPAFLPSCSLSSPSVVVSGSSGASTTLIVNTTAASSTSSLPLRAFSAGGEAGLALVWLIGLSKRRRSWLTCLGLLFVLAGLSVTGCGGGSTSGSGGNTGGSSGTTPGVYTATVTGTSGSLSSSTQIQVTVN